MHEGPDGRFGRGRGEAVDEEEPMKEKPRVAILRGRLLNPFEMQNYVKMQDEFDITTFSPHEGMFDTSTIAIPQQTLWCPISGKIPFEKPLRKWQAARDRLTGRTHSFCGIVDHLRGFDIYHIRDHSFCFSYEAALAKRKWGGRLVVTEEENIPHLNEHKFMERNIKRAVKEQADFFLPVNEAAASALRQEGVTDEKMRMISSAVDTDHFMPGKPEAKLRESLGIPKDAFVLICVARIAKSKGVFTLLEATRKILETEKDFHVLIVGRDEEGGKAYIDRHGLQGSVHLAGFVDYARMPRYYRLADLFILPSIPTRGWVEQGPYSILEAMACGVPVMGSDCGGIPQAVGDGARVFPPGDAEGLARVLLSIKKNYHASLRKKARERAVRLYSTKVLTAKLRHIYREVLAMGPAPAQEGTVA
jgi:glycosyltransferase involved in cell wall biosynthesis